MVSIGITAADDSQVRAALFTPLVGYDDASKPYELAADSITTTDNKLWTVKLKPSWTFHNGEPVSADSYLNAWNYAKNQAHEPLFDNITALTKVDDL
ncbi:MAG TPA: ABC transporter substrate-binding protein, partial [Acidimicrobiia bacterium]|nr:ABC transporter substrate-binding protein [Acidimicrobiia bacterium]